MPTTRPRGRRPGRTETRSEILTAALKLFSEVGYEKVSLRAIAREAEVDPALIHHYFEDKADLFEKAVLDLPLDDAEKLVGRILDGPDEETGVRTATAFLDAWDVPGARDRFTAMLRAAVTKSGEHRPLSEFLSREVFTKVAEAHGHADAKLRAQLAVSVILAYSLGRDVLQLPALAKAKKAQMVTALSVPMQQYLVDAWK